MSDIEHQLKEAARKSGLSMKALSDRSGVYYSAVHGFLTGDRQISIGYAARLAKALNLELRPIPKSRRKG